MNSVLVVLSGFRMRLFCPGKTLCRYGCIYFLCGCYSDVICVGHDLNRCTGCW